MQNHWWELGVELRGRVKIFKKTEQIKNVVMINFRKNKRVKDRKYNHMILLHCTVNNIYIVLIMKTICTDLKKYEYWEDGRVEDMCKRDGNFIYNI